MVYTALMTALVFVATFTIKVPVPFTNGYIHPGDSMVFLAGLLLGPFYGAFAAGIGSALADLIAGYTFWMIPTLLIKGLMGFVVGLIATKIKSRVYHLLTGSLAAIWALFTLFTINLLSRAEEGSLLFESTLKMFIQESDTVMTNAEFAALIGRTGTYMLIVLIALPIVLAALLLSTRFLNKNALPARIAIAYVLAGIIMVFGYYLTYGLLVGNYLVPVFSIPSNMLQFIGGFIIASFLTPVMLKIRRGLAD